MAYYPLTQRDHGFQILDLKNLGRATSKTFERLAPYTLLQNPSSSEAQPIVTKVINKLKTYIESIDSSINVVHMAYQMSKIAGALWTNPGSLSEKQALIERMERQKRLEDLVVLADEAHKKAQKAFNVFKQAEQDFYRIAASTKDLNHTIQIPVDPALPKLITKPLKDVGTDLVSNLSLIKEFSRHISNLTSWSGGVKASILAIDGTVTPTRDGYLLVDIVRPKWDKVRTDCLMYHTIMSDTLDRYNALLPTSSDVWRATIRELDQVPNPEGKPKDWYKRPKLSQKMSALFQDAVRHLSCHTPGCFGP